MNNMFAKWWKEIVYFIICIIIGASLTKLIGNYEDVAIWLFGIKEGKANGSLLTVILTSIGGLLVAFNLYQADKRLKAQHKQINQQIRQNSIAEKGQVDSRFGSAVELLGNENPAVVLGGIHTLHRIAEENESYRHVVLDIFCSYLREKSKELYPTNKLDKLEEARLNLQKECSEKNQEAFRSILVGVRCPVIIQTLVDLLLKEENNIYSTLTPDFSNATFINVDFGKANILNGIFKKTTFIGCEFVDAMLTNCGFWKAVLTNCEFWKSTLTSCAFDEATLTDCAFATATLTWICHLLADKMKKGRITICIIICIAFDIKLRYCHIA